MARLTTLNLPADEKLALLRRAAYMANLSINFCRLGLERRTKHYVLRGHVYVQNNMASREARISK